MYSRRALGLGGLQFHGEVPVKRVIAFIRPLLVLALMASSVMLLVRATFLLLPESMNPPLRETIIALVASLSAALAVWLAGVLAFRGLYGDALPTALRDHTLTLIGAVRPVQGIEDGETLRPPNAKGPQMGPRMVILRGSVATLYRGARQERVEGPGTFWLRPWEYVAHAHGARPKLKPLVIRSVLTDLEHIPVTVTLNLIYGLALPDEVVRGQRALEPAERTLVARMDLATPDAEAMVRAVVEQEMRRAVAQRTFDALLSPSELRRLDDEMRQLANLRLRPRGVRVRSVTITEIAPTQDMLDAINQAQADLILEGARAEAWRSALQRVAEGYKVAKQTPAMTDDDVKREVLRRVLDALARAPKEANSALSASVVQSLVNGVQGGAYPGMGYGPLPGNGVGPLPGGAGPGIGGANPPGVVSSRRN
jgi:regulator of protease activity HflC (stomatin/prohibitin superfamily)